MASLQSVCTDNQLHQPPTSVPDWVNSRSRLKPQPIVSRQSLACNSREPTVDRTSPTVPNHRRIPTTKRKTLPGWAHRYVKQAPQTDLNQVVSLFLVGARNSSCRTPVLQVSPKARPIRRCLPDRHQQSSPAASSLPSNPRSILRGPSAPPHLHLPFQAIPQPQQPRQQPRRIRRLLAMARLLAPPRPAAMARPPHTALINQPFPA